MSCTSGSHNETCRRDSGKATLVHQNTRRGDLDYHQQGDSFLRRRIVTYYTLNGDFSFLLSTIVPHPTR